MIKTYRKRAACRSFHCNNSGNLQNAIVLSAGETTWREPSDVGRKKSELHADPPAWIFAVQACSCVSAGGFDEFLFKGSEFGHWKVRGGHNAFAFRHPSLAQMDVYQLLESEAHHHKISPVGTGRLIAMVGTTDPDHQGSTNLQVLFGLVLTIIPRTTKNKNELPAARIHRSK